MKYFLDTEFIEDGRTIDLISVGIVCEDSRSYYAQNKECDFKKASDWVWRNVFPHLQHFDMCGNRGCKEPSLTNYESLRGSCGAPDCPWRYHWEIRNQVRDFMDIEKFGEPEVWGYYADYDWVAFCQLFGTMMELPKGFPMYCRDVKQLCVSVGDPRLPDSGVHNALNDALHVKAMYEMLTTSAPNA